MKKQTAVKQVKPDSLWQRFPYVVKWGQMLGSLSYYIQEQLELAAADNAPANAIYRKSDSTWATTDDVTSNYTRWVLGLPLLPVPAQEPKPPATLLRVGAYYPKDESRPVLVVIAATQATDSPVLMGVVFRCGELGYDILLAEAKLNGLVPLYRSTVTLGDL